MNHNPSAEYPCGTLAACPITNPPLPQFAVILWLLVPPPVLVWLFIALYFPLGFTRVLIDLLDLVEKIIISYRVWRRDHTLAEAF